MKLNWLKLKEIKLPRRRNLFLVCSVLLLLVSIVISAALYIKYGRKAMAASGSCDAGGENCTISGSGSFDLVEGQYENSNLTIDGSTVSLWGPHHFKNLTIKNNAVVTHQILISVNDYDDTTWALSANGQRKIVDLTIDDELIFQTGGTINVDGKGYAGAGEDDQRLTPDCGDKNIPFHCGYGDGFGGGGNNDSYDEWTRGAGGSYGGKGGEGVHYNGGYAGWAKAPYGNLTSDITTAQPGSGGGAALRHRHNSRSPGAAGGGRIHIVTGTISTDGTTSNYISAKGASVSTADCSWWAMCGGSGSGGSIYIRLTSYGSESNFDVSVAGGRSDVVATMAGAPGVATVRGFNNSEGKQLKVNADGGAGGYDDADRYSGCGGGGGRVLIEVKVNYSIKKVLEPLERGGVKYDPADQNTNFDPYSLRLNDKILVNLYAVRLDSSTIIKDSILREANTYLGNIYCEPIPASISDGGTYDATSGTVTWPAVSDSTHTFTYQCKVRI
ncbi:MAG: hypothetical protein WC451_03435 [Patescibacteria group bacterium]|jgi:hypothetical protein